MNKNLTFVPEGPVPSSRQMAWYRRGKTAFVHFSMNTFTGREWGDGTEDPALFAPTDLDCSQWARVLRDGGFTAAILTAKHHDGFCLWPSRYTDHTVARSPEKTDVVRAFVDACREYGISPGVYISPWDRNHPAWGTECYNDVFAGQLTELMTGYGPLCECWWDGAGSTETCYDWARWAGIVRKYQPDCVIFGCLGAAEYVDVRWVGNESGIAGDSCYATIDPRSILEENTRELNTGKPDGPRFIPAETNLSIRPGWFYHANQDDNVKTPEELTDYWFRSAGRNTGILLNLPPDRRGRIHERDAESVRLWDRNIKRIFSHNLILEGTVCASSRLSPEYPAENLTDPRDSRVYAAGESCPVITVAFPEERTFDCFRLEETIELGHRVRGFLLEAKTGGRWREIHRGGCIGFCQSRRFSPVSASEVRLTVTESSAWPVLRFFGLYRGAMDHRQEAKDTFGAVPVRELRREGEALILNLGGIYPYNTLRWQDPEVQRLEIWAFNGTRYVQVYAGALSGSVRFPTVTGSYQMKLIVTEGTPDPAIAPEVLFSKDPE